MATRKEMEDIIRKIDLEFGKDPDGDTPLEDLDSDEIKEIYDEYMDKYASKKKDTKVKRAKDGGMMNKKKLTRTVPPKKGPNSQGMRGTGIAIRGTKFKGVF